MLVVDYCHHHHHDDDHHHHHRHDVGVTSEHLEKTANPKDLKLRGAIIRDKELIMLPNEQVRE